MASILKVDSIGKTSGSTQDTMKGLVKVWFAVTSAMAGGKSGSYAENINHYYEDDPCTSSSIRLAIDYNNSLADGERSSGQISGDLA